MASAKQEHAPTSIDDLYRADDSSLEEGDVRELATYSLWESDNHTLVGIGPRPRPPVPKPPRKAELAEDPQQRNTPHSEQPGPFIAAEGDTPLSFRTRKRGVWTVAVPALLVVAAVVVLVVRALGPSAAHTSQLAAAREIEQDNAGLVVKPSAVDVHVYLDGQDRGQAPVLVIGLKPGPHVLSISGPAYAPFEQPVTLFADQVRTLEPALTFVRGTLRLSAGDGAEGADVEVVGAGETRALKVLPATIEVAPGEYEVRATRAGFSGFTRSVALSAALPSADVKVELARDAVATDPHGVKRHVPARDVVAGAPPGATGASVPGSITITSSPPSNLVLDGRPIGIAPRFVDVSPGLHQILFIHPKYGRQSLSVNVLPGETTNASADF